MWTPKSKSKLLLQTQSPYQSIELYQNGNHYWMALNRVMQFHTKECYTSHAYMCQIPLNLVKDPRKVLIIGGGDGFAAQEMAKDPRVKEIINVELDGTLVDITRDHPIMKQLTEGSFSNPKVKVIKGDGIGYLLKSKDKFDIIIDDCEYEYTDQPGGRKDTKYLKYLKCLVKKLNPGGVSCIMEPLVKVQKNGGSAEKALTSSRYFIDIFGRVIPHTSPMYSEDRYKKDLKKRFMHSGEHAYWKALAPHSAIAIHMSHIIGPEAYIFMSKDPITPSRWLGKKH